MLALAAFALAPTATASLSGADPTLVDNMDAQSPKLQALASGAGFSVGQRTIDRRVFRYGRGAEKLLLRGPAGRSAQVVYQLSAAPVIHELKIAVDVRTNRPGLQLAAKVVLPRSVNRSTGKPFELLVRGSKIGSGGAWEHLVLADLPQQLANHARVARAQYGDALDERGAYVSQVVLLVPGGTGLTELIVDRVQVFGVVNENLHGEQPATASLQSSSDLRARVPRIIQWRGESFDLLVRLGFNAIAMDRVPTQEQWKKLDPLNLAVFCPPPPPHELAESGIPEEWSTVLAWNLGNQLSSDDLDSIDRWAKLLARHDPDTSRPTVLEPLLSTLDSSRISDVVLVGREVVGTPVTLREHAAWLGQRQRLARPGTPIWTKIETQPSASQLSQLAALGAAGPTSRATTYSQLVAMTSAAMSIKSRGLYFESQEAISPTDLQSRERLLALELTNLRLTLAEPWMTQGKQHSAARSTIPDLSALVLHAERSRLLVPIWWSQDMQSSVHPRKVGPLSFVVPGVAESSGAYLVTLGGMQRLRHQRVTGGIRVSLDALPYDGFVLLSDDPQAIAQVTKYVRRIAQRATKLRRDLAEMRLRQATQIVARTNLDSSDSNPSERLLSQGEAELAACEQYIKAGSYELAYLKADAAEWMADELQRGVSPALLRQSFTTLAGAGPGPLASADRQSLERTLARAPVSANLLAGGGFENLSAMLDNGWRHKQLPLEGITTAVRLSPEAPHSGSYCLELEARAIDETSPVAIVPTAPVWITSAPVNVQRGDLLEITGVARLPEPLLGSVDGLQIIDSIGGREMALRIHEGPSWKPFRVIRAATKDEPVSVSIALSGLGKVQVDDVAVRVVKRR